MVNGGWCCCCCLLFAVCTDEAMLEHKHPDNQYVLSALYIVKHRTTASSMVEIFVKYGAASRPRGHTQHTLTKNEE